MKSVRHLYKSRLLSSKKKYAALERPMQPGQPPLERVGMFGVLVR